MVSPSVKNSFQVGPRLYNKAARSSRRRRRRRRRAAAANRTDRPNYYYYGAGEWITTEFRKSSETVVQETAGLLVCVYQEFS
jgi:hypothetical protein